MRRFGLLDFMILIAGLAPGMAASTISVPTIVDHWNAINWTHLTSPLWTDTIFAHSSQHSLRSGVLQVLAFVDVNLLGLSLAQILMRLRRPRPSVRVFVVQPGFVACLSALIGIAVLVTWGTLAGSMNRYAASACASLPALAVLSSWLGLVAARRWRAEPSWIDRLGRGLGVLWIATSAGLAVGFLTWVDT